MRILIFRALKIGDLLCSMPALRALRINFPDAHIAILALPASFFLLERYHEYIDEIIPFSGYPGLPEIKFDYDNYQSMIQHIRVQKFDLLIQMHGNGIGIQSLIADFEIPNVWAYSAIAHPDLVLYPDHLHEVDRHLHLLSHYGVPIDSQEIPFPLYPEDRTKFDRLKEEYSQLSGPYVVLHMGASTPQRMWGIDNFVVLAQQLHQMGYNVVLSGVDNEQYLAQDFQNKIDFTCINLMGKADLGCTAYLLMYSEGLATNCTGVSHIAASTKTKSIVFSKDGEPYRWGPLDRAVHTTLDCSKEDKLNEVVDTVNNLFKPLTIVD